MGDDGDGPSRCPGGGGGFVSIAYPMLAPAKYTVWVIKV
jgi:hypothetical protein